MSIQSRQNTTLQNGTDRANTSNQQRGTVDSSFVRARIAGIEFDFLTADEVVATLLRWKATEKCGYLTLTNPHSVMLARRDKEMRLATEHATLTLPDGIGVVCAAMMLGFGRRHRVAGPHLMLRLCDLGRHAGLRHFFYGGAPGIADQLVQRLGTHFPGLHVAGTFCPPFRDLTPSERIEVVRAINESKCDIVWVGLGAPKQEKWIRRVFEHIDCTAMIGVGAAFDFHSGKAKWAPKVVRRLGLEWAFRLCCEPGRLWKRNLDSPLFLLHSIGQRLSDILSVDNTSSRLVSTISVDDTCRPRTVIAQSTAKVELSENLDRLNGD